MSIALAISLVISSLTAGQPLLIGIAAADNSTPVALTTLDGDGSEGDPYRITNASELQAVEHDLDAYYRLAGDIDASETANWNGGLGFEPIGDSRNRFTGTFDGNNHTISSLTIDRTDADFVGLFGVVGPSGSISNIGLEDADVAGNDWVGVLVGDNQGELSQSYATGSVKGASIVGGLVGENRGEVVESYATTSVHGSSDVGGLVGENRGEVAESYATGTVSGNSSVGGLVGRNTDSIVDSYWDTEATIQSNGIGVGETAGATGLTTAEMQRFAPLVRMAALDYDATWTIVDDYPHLTWEGVEAVTVNDFEAQNETASAGAEETIKVSVNASDAASASGVNVKVVDNGSLSGLNTGDTSETNENGVATFTFDESTAGTYEVTFAWETDAEVTDTATVTVERLAPSRLEAIDETESAGVEGRVQVRFTDEFGNVAPNETIVVIENGSLSGLSADETAETNESGVATFGFNEEAAGAYEVTFAWENDTAIDAVTTVTIDAAVPDSLTADDATEAAGAEGELAITLRDRFNNPVPNEAVTVANDGGFNGLSEGETAETNESGIATFAFTGGAADEYTVLFELDSDDTITDTATVTINPLDPNTLAAANATETAGETGEIVVSFMDEYGNPGAGESIIVADNGSLDGLDADETLVTNENGVATFGFNEETAGKYTVAIALEGDDTITDTATVTVDPQGPKTLDAADTTEAAGETGAITITLRDEFGNVVPDESVNVTADGGLGGLGVGDTGKTNESGVATLPFEEDTAGEYTVTFALKDDGTINDTATVTVAPAAADLANSSVTPIDTTTNISDDFERENLEYTVSFADAFGNALADVDVTLDGGENVNVEGGVTQTTDGDGNATFVVQSTTPQTDVQFTFTEHHSDLEFTATGTFEPVDPNTLVATNAASTAGESGSIGVSFTDEFNNPGSDESITVVETGGLGGLTANEAIETDESGQVAFTFDEEVADTYTVTFALEDDGTINDTATVTVSPAAADPAASSVEPTEDSTIVSDNFEQDSLEYTVSFADAFGNALADVDVTLDGGENIAVKGGSTQTTDGDGNATFVVQSTTPQTDAQFTFTEHHSNHELTATGTFESVPPNTLVAANTTSPAGTTSEITVAFTDEFGNPGANANVTVTDDAGPGGLDAGETSETNESGVATFAFNETIAGEYTVTFTLEDDDGTINDTATVTVAPAAADPANSSVTPADAAASISDDFEQDNLEYTVSFTDAFGNALADVDVTLDGGENIAVKGGSTQTADGDGNATFVVQSTTPQTDTQFTFTEHHSNHELTATGTFEPANATTLTVADVTEFADVEGEIVVALTDEFDNGIHGETINVTAADLDGVNIGDTQDTDDGGEATFVFTEDVPDEYDLTFTLESDNAINDSATVTIERSFAGGDGTAENPYEIADWHHLHYVRYYLDANFTLIDDLDDTDEYYDAFVGSPSAGFEPIADSENPFTGTFDGDNHTISGLLIDESQGRDSALFLEIDGAMIANVGLVNTIISAGEGNSGEVGSDGGNAAGFVISSTDATLSGVYVENATINAGDGGDGPSGNDRQSQDQAPSIPAEDGSNGGNAGSAAGLIVDARDTILNDSFISFSTILAGDGGSGGRGGDNCIRATCVGTEGGGEGGDGGNGGNSTGFIVVKSGGVVRDSYVYDSTIKAGSRGSGGSGGKEFNGRASSGSSGIHGSAAGVVITNSGDVTSVISTADISAPGIATGLIVENDELITDSYWNTDVTDIDRAVGSGTGSEDQVVGVTSAQMLGVAETEMSNLDFESTWDVIYVKENGFTWSYPFLQNNTQDPAPGLETLYAGGNGTAEDPYQVENWLQLDYVRVNLDAEFVQTADLDIHADHYGAIFHQPSSGFEPIGDSSNRFAGSFDGDNYTISNLVIDRPDADAVGLFGVVGPDGIISNAGVNAYVEGDDWVGALIGDNMGEVTRSYATGSVKGDSVVGGLIGENRGDVTDSYATASVDGSNDVGGVVGENRGDVSKTYAAGAVSGNGDNVGGLVGRNTASILDSYWDKEATAQANGVGGGDKSGVTGLTTTPMQRFAPLVNMPALDYDAMWTITGDYPRLTWEGADEASIDGLEAGDETAIAGENGSVDVTAELGKTDAGEGVNITVVDNDSLAGLHAGETLVTNESGQVTFTFNETVAGEYTVTFALEDDATTADTATVTVIPAAADPANSSVNSTDDRVAASDEFGDGNELTYTLSFADAYGNALAGIDVEFASDGIVDVHGHSTQTTDDDGNVTFTVQSTTPQTDVQFTFTERHSDFELTANGRFDPASASDLVAADATSVAGAEDEIVLTLTDAFENPISDESVVVVDDGDLAGLDAGETLETNESGQVAFTVDEETAGSYELTFALEDDGSISDTATVTVAAAGATTVDVRTEPRNTTAGEQLEEVPAASVTDEFGNLVAGVSVSVREAGGYEFDAGTLTRQTGADGVATFDGLMIREAAEDYRLEFSIDAKDAGVSESSTDTTGRFDIGPAASDELTAMNATATAGDEGTISVALTDEFDNRIAGETIEIASADGLTLSSGIAVTNGEGVATFTFEEDAPDEYEVTLEVRGRPDVTDTATVTVEAVIDAVEVDLNDVRQSVSDDFSDGNQLVATVTVSDVDTAPVAGVAVELTDTGENIDVQGGRSQTTDENGETTFVIQSTTAQQNVQFTFTEIHSGNERDARITGFAFETGDPATGMLDGTNATATAGQEDTVTVSLTDEFGNRIVGEPITVADDAGLSGVTTGETRETDENGELTFAFEEQTAGEYDVTFELVADGGVGNTATVTITPAAAKTGAIAAPSVTATAGQAETITVIFKDDFGNPLQNETIAVTDDAGLSGITTGDTNKTDENGKVTFTFDESVVAEYGVEFEASGHTGITTTAEVTVEPTAPDNLEVTLSTLTTTVSDEFGDGDEITATVTVLDAYETPVPNATVTLTDDGREIEVPGGRSQTTDDNGEATFTFRSTAAQEDIRIDWTEQRSGEHQSVSGFAFERGDISDATLTAPNVTEVAGKQGTIEATLADEFGNPFENETVEVTASGDLAGLATSAKTNESGVATFTFEETIAGTYGAEFALASHADVADAATVEITPAALHSVEIEPSGSQTITAGETIAFDATAYDEFENVIENDDSIFTWANTTDVGTFEQTTADTYSITATLDEETSETATVTVESAAVDSVTISPGDRTITAGETIAFDATAHDEFGNVVEDDDGEFTWTNTTKRGTFEDTTTGTYSITATIDGVTSEVVSVTVTPAAVDSISVSPDDDRTITAGETIAFDATAYDEFGNVVEDDNTEFTWMNATAGTFSPPTVGTYEVTATMNDVTSETVSVRVDPATVDSVIISPDDDQMIIAGEIIAFDATAYDEFGNVVEDDDSAFTWSNTTGAGTLENTTAGTYEVGATYDEVASAMTLVTVEPGDVTSIELSPSDAQTITAGETITFDATAFDGFGNVVTSTTGDFTWSNATTVGVFENATAGTYNVTASVDGVTSASTTVTVNAQSPSPTLPSPSPSPSPSSPSDEEPEDMDMDEEPEVETTSTRVNISQATTGETVEINGETAGTDRPLGELDNIAVDDLSIEMAVDRDFWIEVSTFERDQAADTDADDESTDDGADVASRFETETGTVSAGTVRVTHNLDPDDIAGATFEFRIRQSYLSGLDVPVEEVTLYRQVDREWVPLPPTHVSSNETYHRFEAVSPGFSYFAIGTGAATFDVTAAELDRATIAEGETATVTATVENRGTSDGSYAVTLVANGEAVAEETVMLDGNESTAVALTFAPSAVGEYDISVGDRTLETLSVVPTDESDSAVDETPDTDAVTNETADEEASTGIGLSGWLLLGVIVSSAVAVVLWRRRAS